MIYRPKFQKSIPLFLLPLGLATSSECIDLHFEKRANNEFVIGIGTHFSGGKIPITVSLDFLADTGVTQTRDDAFWNRVGK